MSTKLNGSCSVSAAVYSSNAEGWIKNRFKCFLCFCKKRFETLVFCSRVWFSPHFLFPPLYGTENIQSIFSYVTSDAAHPLSRFEIDLTGETETC